MITSDEVKNIAQALVTAQSNFKKVEKQKEGYGYKYAELQLFLDATQPALNAAGITINQAPTDTGGGQWVCTTQLTHVSGEWFRGVFPILTDNKGNKMQGFGSAMTYARRYGLQALVGISSEDEDDDGVASRETNKPAAPKPVAPSIPRLQPVAPKPGAAIEHPPSIISMFKVLGQSAERMPVGSDGYAHFLAEHAGKQSAGREQIIAAVRQRVDEVYKAAGGSLRKSYPQPVLDLLKDLGGNTGESEDVATMCRLVDELKKLPADSVDAMATASLESYM